MKKSELVSIIKEVIQEKNITQLQEKKSIDFETKFSKLKSLSDEYTKRFRKLGVKI